MRLGIISALHEEQQGLVEAMQGPAKRIHGMREYSAGRIGPVEAVSVLWSIGKVAGTGDARFSRAGDLVRRTGATSALAAAGEPQPDRQW